MQEYEICEKYQFIFFVSCSDVWNGILAWHRIDAFLLSRRTIWRNDAGDTGV